MLAAKSKFAVLLFGLLFIVTPVSVLAQDTSSELPEPTDGSGCPRSPRNAQPVEYKILLIQRLVSLKRHGPEVQPTLDSVRDASPELNLQGRQQIRDESEYQSVFGKPSVDVNWNSSRIAVVPLLSTYKFDKLDSTVTLAGISQSADAIYIELTLTQVGPCQGIAQKSEWFSTDQLICFVLLPRQPERLITYTCVVGGCLPDIP